jgi:AcrR family transcriptional regulator
VANSSAARTAGRTAAKRAPPKPAPRARLDVDERRAQLLALGLAMFSERSYDEVSIDDLAAAAGVSKGLLYHYFPTKRDLYVAALDAAAQDLCAQTVVSPDVGPPEQRLVRGLATYMDFVDQHGKAYVALMRGGIGSDPEVASILEQTRTAFAARILEALPRDQAQEPFVALALRGWIGFVEATSIEWVARPAAHRDDLVELLASMLVPALACATGIAGRARPLPPRPERARPPERTPRRKPR